MKMDVDLNCKMKYIMNKVVEVLDIEIWVWTNWVVILNVVSDTEWFGATLDGVLVIVIGRCGNLRNCGNFKLAFANTRIYLEKA